MSDYDRDTVFNVKEHRCNDNYTADVFRKRILWMFCRPLLNLVPRFFYEFRNRILRLFGAKIGKSVRIYPSVEIFYPWNIEIGDEVTISDRVQLYSLGKIIIGDGTMISYGAHFCAGTHDYSERNLPLLKPEVRLGKGIWVCTEAFVGPGVTVGDFSIIGAKAVVLKSFPDFSIIGGNPARRVKERSLPEEARKQEDNEH